MCSARRALSASSAAAERATRRWQAVLPVSGSEYVRYGHETAPVVCGRFTSSQRREVIGERFEVAVPETYTHRFNLAPQQRALIIRKSDDEREAVMAKWGLLPRRSTPLSLLEPYPAELMLALPASTRANSVRNDDSGLLLPDDVLAA
jgi:putative SOS response-associated peptidase YedK